MDVDRRAALLALGTAALAPATIAFAQGPADPAQPIRRVEAALAGSAAALPSLAAVRAEVDRSFDMEGIARAVLAGLAPHATDAQVARFREALTSRIARDLLGRRRRQGRGTLQILGTRPAGSGLWLVTSRIRLARQYDRAVNWRVRSTPRGPAIGDVIGGGSSLIRALRNEYGPALRRLGLDGLIARMETRRARG